MYYCTSYYTIPHLQHRGLFKEVQADIDELRALEASATVEDANPASPYTGSAIKVSLGSIGAVMVLTLIILK